MSPYDIEESRREPESSPAGLPPEPMCLLTSKIELVENAELWSTWRFKMPVIMNSNERSG